MKPYKLVVLLTIFALMMPTASGYTYSSDLLISNNLSSYYLYAEIDTLQWEIGDTVSITATFEADYFSYGVTHFYDVTLWIRLVDDSSEYYFDISTGYYVFSEGVSVSYTTTTQITDDFPPEITIEIGSTFYERDLEFGDCYTDDGWFYVEDSVSIVRRISTTTSSVASSQVQVNTNQNTIDTYIPSSNIGTAPLSIIGLMIGFTIIAVVNMRKR